MKRRMPLTATEAELLSAFSLRLVSRGPRKGAWHGNYLKCPLCQEFVLKGGGNHGCRCGNLFVDGDMLRVSVVQTPETQVEVYDAR